MTFQIDTTTTYTDDERAAFMEGWQGAGGFMEDAEQGTSTPWCCPWYSCGIIKLTVSAMPTPYDAGRLWWDECRDEIEDLLAKEAAACEKEEN